MFTLGLIQFQDELDSGLLVCGLGTRPRTCDLGLGHIRKLLCSDHWAHLEKGSSSKGASCPERGPCSLVPSPLPLGHLAGSRFPSFWAASEYQNPRFQSSNDCVSLIKVMSFSRGVFVCKKDQEWRVGRKAGREHGGINNPTSPISSEHPACSGHSFLCFKHK